MRAALRLLVIGTPVLFACQDNPGSDPTAPPPSFAISDAAHDGREGFYFLPPLVPDPGATGEFDPALLPFLKVEVCEWDGTTCVGDLVAEFSADAGTGSEVLRIGDDGEHYIVNWHTDSSGLDAALTYRIVILAAGTSLGYADVDVVSGGSGLKNVNTNEFIALKDDRTLPITFRIAEGAVFVVGEDGGEITAMGGRVRLEIPAGSLLGDVGITVEPSTSFPADQSLIPGTVFDFQPDGTAFSSPASLTLTYDEVNLGDLAESELTILTEEEAEWVGADGSSVDEVANTVTALIDGFSRKGVGGRVTAVDVTPPAATLDPTETLQLTAIPRIGTGDPVARKVSWTSLDIAVATVDRTGLVTAVAPGTVTIEATSGSATGSAEITVTGILQPGDLCSDFPATAIATFEDANLEAAVRSKLGIGAQDDLTCGLLSGLTTLNAASLGIVSIVGIQNLTSLWQLLLDNNSISDISPLSGLTSLTRLQLNVNSISDISALSGLTNLTWLQVGNNSISDIGALSGLTSLTTLALHNNSFTDVSPLSGLTSLTTLSLYNNSFTGSIGDINALSGLTSLTWLGLGGNVITDISALSGLTSLTTLSLYFNSISDVSALSGLTNLTTLDLQGNNSISDVSALSGLTSLVDLLINGNSISDISPLSGLTSLTRLGLSGNSISDISVLSGLTSLTVLGLQSNSITDISVLSGLTSLIFLNVGFNSISDISALTGLTSLMTLYLYGNAALSNIQPLLDNTGLGAGDTVFLTSTNVSCTDVAALRAKGVTVVSPCV